MAATPRKPRSAATKSPGMRPRAAASVVATAARKRAPAKAAAAARKPAPAAGTARKSTASAANPRKSNAPAEGLRKAKVPAATARRSAAPDAAPRTRRVAAATERKRSSRRPPRTEAERDRQFSVLLHTSCLKAGTAAVVTTLSTRVPLLNRIAPVLVGSMMQSLAVPRIQQQLVLDVLALYQLELSELEQQGVVLLATAANVGAQELSRRTVEQLVNRVGAPLGRPILDRMLPVTNLVAENAAAVASTYAVGRRAQALCRLGGSGARDLGELLGAITGIDQRRLVDWSTEAVKMALKPFRAALLTLKPLG